MNMQTAIHTEIASALPFTSATADYETVRRAIAFVSENFRDQPEVEAVADAAGTTPRALTELFRRWCGLTPKEFLAARTLPRWRTCAVAGRTRAMSRIKHGRLRLPSAFSNRRGGARKRRCASCSS